MTILFSPIGNSDPWRNNRDGAMLHIVRHYQPKKVFLFFTKSIWEGNEKHGGQKGFNWKEIIQEVSPNTQIEVIIEDIDNPQDFDAFKDIFHQNIDTISKNFKNEELLLNVTSGTPQMETTLCLEYVTYPDNKKCIQVTTPIADSNVNTHYSEHMDAEIDMEIVNEEESHHNSRCKEIEILSFRETIIRNQLKELINNYDYEAAYQLLVPNSEFRNRMQLMKKLLSIKENIKHHKVFDEIISKYKHPDVQKVLFHFQLIKMKQQREDMAELVIRLKSLEEYIIQIYLKRKYPDLLEKGKAPKLSKKTDQTIINNYIQAANRKQMSIRTSDKLSLVLYEYLAEALQEDVLKTHIVKVKAINDLRNNVAHHLNEINLNGSVRQDIKEAVVAVKDSISLTFNKVNEKDFDILEKMNQELINLL